RVSFPCFIRVSSVAVFLSLAPFLGCGQGDDPVAVAAPETIKTKSGVEMVRIPAGSFEMGSKNGRDEERPVHKVWVDAFLMDKYEVMQAEYEKLGKIEAFPNPSHFKGADLPVEQCNWRHAGHFW